MLHGCDYLWLQVPGVLALQEVCLWRQLQHAHPAEPWLKERTMVARRVEIKDVVKALLLPALLHHLNCCQGSVRTRFCVPQLRAVSTVLDAGFHSQEQMQDGVVVDVVLVHVENAATVEFLKPAGVKRARHHTVANGFSWGGFPAVHEAAAAMPAASLLSKHASLSTLPACAMLAVHRPSLLVGGRYLKLKRLVPQSPWFPSTNAATDDAPTSSVQVRPHLDRAYPCSGNDAVSVLASCGERRGASGGTASRDLANIWRRQRHVCDGGPRRHGRAHARLGPPFCL